MRAHLRTKGHLLTPALEEIWWTRADCLQWHTENAHKNILFMDEKFFTIEEQYNNQNNKLYAQMSLEVHSEGAGMPSPFLRHGLVGGVPSGGDTSSFFQERRETCVPSVSRGRATRSCETALTWPSSVVRNGSSSRTQFLPKNQDDSGVAAEECSGLYQRRGLALGESRPQPPGTINCGLFWRTWLAKSITTIWTVWRDPPGDGACSNSRVARAYQGLCRGRRRPFLSGIIINKNLKLLLINYLARKVDVLFHFPARSQYTWDKTYGRTVWM